MLFDLILVSDVYVILFVVCRVGDGVYFSGGGSVMMVCVMFVG